MMVFAVPLRPRASSPFIDFTAATLEDLEDPIASSDRAPLTGNISSSQAQGNARAASNTQGYLTSAIGGEDRRAPVNTIDESVWETLRRDLLAVWEKMRQVLYPKYLLGGIMNRGGGIGDAEQAEQGDAGQIRGLVGRWPDADTVLQSGMSEGLRDWDLWFVLIKRVLAHRDANDYCRGPLLFCLLLSFLLSINAREEQRSLVFSGVFAMIWIAEAVVTLQIKLLGGNMFVPLDARPSCHQLTDTLQFILPVGVHYRLHAVSLGHRLPTLCPSRSDHRSDTSLQCAWSLVAGGWCKHFGRKWRCQKPRGIGRVSAVRVLYWARLPVFHFIEGHC